MHKEQSLTAKKWKLKSSMFVESLLLIINLSALWKTETYVFEFEGIVEDITKISFNSFPV